MTNPTCTIDDCEKPLRSSGAKWCKMHYHRWYRHGSTDKVIKPGVAPGNGRRYKRTYKPDHPLANRNGGVYNRLENLVPSCRRCNTARALQAKSDRLRELGWWSNNDTIARLAEGRKPRISTAA